jgi:PAS domain S-box-containing protein
LPRHEHGFRFASSFDADAFLMPRYFTAADVAEAVLTGVADAVVACDREGIICVWNPGAARIFGFSAEEAVGKSLYIIIPERLRARHWDGFHKMMKTGQSRYSGGDLLSVPALRKDGSQISVEFTIVPIKDMHGEVCGLAAVMRDITGRFEELKSLRRQVRERASPASAIGSGPSGRG